eukprot:444072-Prorocentrum_minimum.AAC.1
MCATRYLLVLRQLCVPHGSCRLQAGAVHQPQLRPEGLVTAPLQAEGHSKPATWRAPLVTCRDLGDD